MESRHLTRREMEILDLVAAGYSNKDIGQVCGICEQNVKNHVSRVLEKLGVHNRTQAAIFALKGGTQRERVLERV